MYHDLTHGESQIPEEAPEQRVYSIPCTERSETYKVRAELWISESIGDELSTAITKGLQIHSSNKHCLYTK